MTVTFTTRGVASLPIPPTGQCDYYDGRLPGLGIRISSTGSKSWFIFYRYAGQSRRLTIGP